MNKSGEHWSDNFPYWAMVDIIKLFWGNLDFPNIKKSKNSWFWCMNLYRMWKQCHFMPNYTFNVFVAFKNVYFIVSVLIKAKNSFAIT